MTAAAPPPAIRPTLLRSGVASASGAISVLTSDFDAVAAAEAAFSFLAGGSVAFGAAVASAAAAADFVADASLVAGFDGGVFFAGGSLTAAFSFFSACFSTG